jgi:hypothetical protein
VRSRCDAVAPLFQVWCLASSVLRRRSSRLGRACLDCAMATIMGASGDSSEALWRPSQGAFIKDCFGDPHGALLATLSGRFGRLLGGALATLTGRFHQSLSCDLIRALLATLRRRSGDLIRALLATPPRRRFGDLNRRFPQILSWRLLRGASGDPLGFLTSEPCAIRAALSHDFGLTSGAAGLIIVN